MKSSVCVCVFLSCFLGALDVSQHMTEDLYLAFNAICVGTLSRNKLLYISQKNKRNKKRKHITFGAESFKIFHFRMFTICICLLPSIARRNFSLMRIVECTDL